ncbi:MAG: MFS transporter [Gemmatimonadaceae bacterium]|nr:MFS transporter [Gemmatimonadaceae bacterium]
MTDFLQKRLDLMRTGDAGKLSVLMFTAFIDMVGALMIIPLLPFYAKRFGASDFAVMALVASFSAMQLVSAPLWGRVSDRYGRKPALLFGLGASMFAYIVFAYADSYWLLLASRIIQGAGGGTTGVIQAYVADSMAPKDRARGLGWLSSATNAGVVIGPAIASFSHNLGPHWPGMIAALLCALNILFASRYLPESHDAKARMRTRGGRTPFDAVARVAGVDIDQPYARLIWMYSVGLGAFYGVNALIILFLSRHFDVTENTIGFFFMYMGGLSIVFRLFILGRAVDRYGEVRTARLGALSLACGLALIPLTPLVKLTALPAVSWLPFAIVIALVPLGAALNFPSVTALLSRVVGENERGLYMGVQQTYGGIARVIYPLVAGVASDHLGESSPFWISGGLVLTTIAMGSQLGRYSSRTSEFEAEAVSEEATAEAKAAE